MSTILVTGGNGFVGRHLVTALGARGDRVRVLALPGEDARWLERRGVTVYRGDITKPDSLTAPVEGADGVFHLAAMQDVWRPIEVYRAAGIVIEKKRNVHAFVGDFYPLVVFALLLPLPRSRVEVVARHARDGRHHRVGTDGQAVDFDQAHRGAADLGRRCVQDQTLALQESETTVEQIHPGQSANGGSDDAVVIRIAKEGQ